MVKVSLKKHEIKFLEYALELAITAELKKANSPGSLVAFTAQEILKKIKSAKPK